MLTTLKIYFDELRIRLQVIQRTQQEIDRRFSPDFNLFNLFYLDENSRAVQFLINQSNLGHETTPYFG